MQAERGQVIPILLNLIAAVFGAAGQYFYKKGADKLGRMPLYQNWEIPLGALLFVGVMGLFIFSFKLGGRLSVTYPMYATTFVWGALMSAFALKEPISV
ncbi:MAG: hypothetical protein KGQ59_01390, partial [Bdellovibrionales bacterium]|nr:hypothetical protein [Bdellovibrionales bacterium]